MEKVKITCEQAEIITKWKYNRGILLGVHARDTLATHNCLQNLTLDQLARCLYGEGYEVEVEEQEPQFEFGDWVVNTCHNSIFQLEQSEVKDFLERIPVLKHIRHATESEIAEEEKRRTNKKLDEILLDLSDYERHKLHMKLKWG